MRASPRLTLRRLDAALLAVLAGSAGAQTPTPTQTQVQVQTQAPLQEVVITASRSAQKSFDVPASIQAIGEDTLIDAGPRVNLSEAINRIPGIVALDRQNYAQDLQLSIRGSGARSAFGIRGARLIVDGIPATMPDGQSQASTISLPSAARIEVLRGPLAQLYGNSSAGVVQVFTADGPPRPEVGFSLDAGSNGMRRYGLQLGGQQGALNYVLDASGFETDGYRPNSAAKRRHLNAKLRWDASERTRVTLVANVFDQPESGDPLGLTRAQYDADPKQTAAPSLLYNTGKDVSQSQLGVVVEHQLDADSELSGRIYWGTRDLDNRLSIPLTAQAAATAAGGIVQLDREYGGLGLRYSRRFMTSAGRVQWNLGLDRDSLSERRKGFINNLGVQGALKRDEQDGVRSTGIYTSADWAINEDWSLLAGVRSNRVKFRVRDYFIATGNPDDSGNVSYSATNPVLGITRHLGADLNVYANIGRGFETPTGTEMAYTRGASGPNLGLKPARSTHAELGLKMRPAEGQRLDVALFGIETRDEIVVASNSGGRSIYANAGKTRRTGLEVAYSAQWTPEWRSYAALSTLNAKFRDAFTSNSGDVPAGNRIPGTMNRTLFAETSWQPRAWPGFSAALEVVHRGRMMVNDLNTDQTDSATLLNLRLRWEQSLGQWRLRETLRVDNVGDRDYVGSVIANDGNGRYFEPAPGRQWWLGVSAVYTF